MQQTSFFTNVDICGRNHGGSPESIAAFEGTDREAIRRRVLDAITEAGPNGITVDELAIRWNVGNQTLSGRFSELKCNGLIAKAGTRPTRTGAKAGCYIAVEPKP